MADKETIEKLSALSLLWKIQLENQWKPALNSFFRQLAKDAVAVYIATGSVPTLESFTPELTSILRSHYRDIGSKFENDLRDRITDNQLNNAIAHELRINHNIVQYINRTSIQHANLILDTTRQNLREIAARVTMQAAIHGETLSRKEMGQRIEVEFIRTSDNRVNTIAITETQIPAERIKFIEAQEIYSISQSIPEATFIMVKDWGAIIDKVTRPAHADANQQRKNINEPFIVGGEYMQVPGDESLGATIGNIINCRCGAHVHFIHPNM